MIGYLLAISMILHLITLLGLVLLVKKVSATIDYKQLEQQKREIEDLLAFYAVELKEENERFLAEIQQTTDLQQAEETPVKPQTKIEEEKQKDREEPPSDDRPILEPTTETTVYKPSLEAQVLQLYHEGYNVKEIAKKVNKGHGEIELLLKFNVPH